MKKTTCVLIGLFSLFIGYLRFSLFASIFHVCTIRLKFAPFDAINIVHSSMACTYLFETAAGVITRTRLGMMRTSIILSCGLVVIYLFAYAVPSVANYSNAVIALPEFFILSSLLGGMTHCLKEIFINEFNLPEQLDEFKQIKFYITELEYVGKTTGAIVNAFYETHGNTISSIASLIRFILSLAVLAITVSGFWVFKKQTDYRNTISEFFQHSAFALKEQFTNRITNAENFSTFELERIKVLHSVLPMYVPVIILIGLKDIKFSRYTWQSQQMELKFFEENMNPLLILAVYPLTMVISLPLYVLVLQLILKKYVKRQHWKTTTRALVSFYLMAFSLSAALILECRMEIDNRNSGGNKTMGTVVIFNILPHAAYVKSPCGAKGRKLIQSLKAALFPCPVHNEFNSVLLQGISMSGNLTHLFSITVVIVESQKSYVAIIQDLRVPSNDSNFRPVIFIRLHPPERQLDQKGSKLLVVASTVVSQKVELVQAEHVKNEWVPSEVSARIYTLDTKLPQIDKLDLMAAGWHTIRINDVDLTRTYLEPYSSYVIVISQTMVNQTPGVGITAIHYTKKRSVLQQLPQVVTSGLSEMLIEAPGFMYARKKVPLQWQNFVSTVWTFSCLLGNVITILTNIMLGNDRNLFGFISASASGTIGISFLSVCLLDYYKMDYDTRASEIQAQ